VNATSTKHSEVDMSSTSSYAFSETGPVFPSKSIDPTTLSANALPRPVSALASTSSEAFVLDTNQLDLNGSDHVLNQITSTSSIITFSSNSSDLSPEFQSPANKTAAGGVQNQSNYISNIPGLEIFGSVFVLMGPVDLTIEYSDIETVYALPEPFNGIQLIIPAGAGPFRRSLRNHLTVYVFLIPNSVSVPGESCGPAVFLQRSEVTFQKSIGISLPCSYNETDVGLVSNVPAAVEYSFETGNWSRLQYLPNQSFANGSVWARIKNFSVYTASLLSTEGDGEAPQSRAGGSKVTVLIGSVIGSAFVLMLTSLMVWYRYRMQLKAFKQLQEYDDLISVSWTADRRSSSLFATDAADLVYSLRNMLRRQSSIHQRKQSKLFETDELQDFTYSEDCDTLFKANVGCSDLVYKAGNNLILKPPEHSGILANPQLIFEDSLESVCQKFSVDSKEETKDVVAGGELVYKKQNEDLLNTLSLHKDDLEN
jgi:hypothetical protein